MWRELFQRYYAFRFDSMIAGAERGGLSDYRHDLLCGATGLTIEIGAATGLNIRHFPRSVSRLLMVEPDRHMLRQLRGRIARVSSEARPLRAVAEHLPFPDAVADTVAVIFTLCTVSDQKAALREIARVLVPGGRLLFLEHVRSADPDVEAAQDKIPFPYSHIGCHPNRDTLAEIRSSPLRLEEWQEGEVPCAPDLERPMIVGMAKKPRP